MEAQSIEKANINGIVHNIGDDAEAELLARMQGLSAQNDSQKDPFVYLGTFDSVAALIKRLDSLHTDSPTTFAPNSGHFRARVSYSFFDIVSDARDIAGDIWTQAISGNLTLTDGTLVVSTNNYGTFVRYHDRAINGWTPWTIANAQAIIDIIPAATTTTAGLMSAEDKEKLDQSQSAISAIGYTLRPAAIQLDITDLQGKGTRVSIPAATAENAGVMSNNEVLRISNTIDAVKELSQLCGWSNGGWSNPAVGGEIRVQNLNNSNSVFYRLLYVRAGEQYRVVAKGNSIFPAVILGYRKSASTDVFISCIDIISDTSNVFAVPDGVDTMIVQSVYLPGAGYYTIPSIAKVDSEGNEIEGTIQYNADVYNRIALEDWQDGYILKTKIAKGQQWTVDNIAVNTTAKYQLIEVSAGDIFEIDTLTNPRIYTIVPVSYHHEDNGILTSVAEIPDNYGSEYGIITIPNGVNRLFIQSIYGYNAQVNKIVDKYYSNDKGVYVEKAITSLEDGDGSIDITTFDDEAKQKYGITTAGTKIKVPLKCKGKYSLHVEFKFPDDVNYPLQPNTKVVDGKLSYNPDNKINVLRTDNYKTLDVGEDGYYPVNGGFNVELWKFKPVNIDDAYLDSGKSYYEYFTAYNRRICQPVNLSQITCSATSKLPNYHRPSSINTKDFVGNDAFSVRWKGVKDDTTKSYRYRIDENGFALYVYNGADIVTVPYPTDGTMLTFVENITAIADANNLEVRYYDIFDKKCSELSWFDNVPVWVEQDEYATITDFPCYFYYKDDSWHTIDIVFDPEGGDNDGCFLMFFDEMHQVFYNRERNYKYNGDALPTSVTLDTNGFEFRNFKFTPEKCEVDFPFILVYMLHDLNPQLRPLTDPKNNDSTLGNAARLISAMEKHGFVNVSLTEVAAHFAQGASIPKKCYCITHDDLYFLGSARNRYQDEAMQQQYVEVIQKFRDLYFGHGVKSTYALTFGKSVSEPEAKITDLDGYVIDHNAGLVEWNLHDLAPGGYYLYDYTALKERIATQRRLFADYGMNCNTLSYSEGKKTSDINHYMQNNGFCYGNGVGVINDTITCACKRFNNISQPRIPAHDSYLTDASRTAWDSVEIRLSLIDKIAKK